jgi:hypothetical protein
MRSPGTSHAIDECAAIERALTPQKPRDFVRQCRCVGLSSFNDEEPSCRVGGGMRRRLSRRVDERFCCVGTRGVRCSPTGSVFGCGRNRHSGMGRRPTPRHHELRPRLLAGSGRSPRPNRTRDPIRAAQLRLGGPGYPVHELHRHRDAGERERQLHWEPARYRSAPGVGRAGTVSDGNDAHHSCTGGPTSRTRRHS